MTTKQIQGTIKQGVTLMGMSASQARFLILTAQKNNNEYQAQRITHERLMLAQETEGWTSEYNDKMNNTTLLFNAKTSSDTDLYNYNNKLTYDDIVRSETDENPGIGGRLVTVGGKVVVPKLPEFNEEGLSEDGLTEKDYFVDPEIERSDMLQNALTNGIYFIELKKFTDETGEEEPVWDKVDYANTTETMITETLDKTDDAAAEAEYEEKKSLFQSKDKTLEMRLKELETEHKALETEIESVQKVIQNNVETSFKTFG